MRDDDVESRRGVPSPPGNWAYAKIGIEGGPHGGGHHNHLHALWGHPVLMLKQGGYPKLLDNGYVLSTTEHLERERFSGLRLGTWRSGSGSSASST